MKNTNLLLVSITIILVSCQNKKMETLNPPLATVIKLNAAEALLDFTEAKKYQDINKIYSKDPANNKGNPEDVWREYVTSFNSLGNSKKFTNQWKYFDYDITEKVDNTNAEVIFKSKNTEAGVQAITYKLELRQSAWIVNDIEYKKKE